MTMADPGGDGPRLGALGLQPEPDSDFEAALRKILQVVFRDHPLGANQILTLAAELQRIGVHRLVEEHLDRFAQRAVGTQPPV